MPTIDEIGQTVSTMLRNEANTIDFFLAQFHGRSFMRPFMILDEQAYTETKERISEISQYPFYEAKPMFDQIVMELENLPRTSLVSRSFLPFEIARYPEYRARFEAQVGLLQVGLAIELYHGQHNVYPQSLEEVASILDVEVPLDPYTGEDFVYEPGTENFLLYSARGCAIDEPANEHSYAAYTDRNGNLVWRGPEDWRGE